MGHKQRQRGWAQVSPSAWHAHGACASSPQAARPDAAYTGDSRGRVSLQAQVIRCACVVQHRPQRSACGCPTGNQAHTWLSQRFCAALCAAASATACTRSWRAQRTGRRAATARCCTRGAAAVGTNTVRVFSSHAWSGRATGGVQAGYLRAGGQARLCRSAGSAARWRRRRVGGNPHL